MMSLILCQLEENFWISNEAFKTSNHESTVVNPFLILSPNKNWHALRKLRIGCAIYLCRDYTNLNVLFTLLILFISPLLMVSRPFSTNSLWFLEPYPITIHKNLILAIFSIRIWKRIITCRWIRIIFILLVEGLSNFFKLRFLLLVEMPLSFSNHIKY